MEIQEKGHGPWRTNPGSFNLFNLCIVVLVDVNGRLTIVNLIKHGLLINFNFWFSSRSLRDWRLLMCCSKNVSYVFPADSACNSTWMVSP
ncbi:putative diacylglycerol O-acyltransferase [Helianthus debilis subsp. tardiflorus]